jgi:hypothetical protein
MELRLSKSTARQTKRQIRNNYDWDNEEANFADSVSSFAKEYLFQCFNFLKDRWMDYDKGQDSFSTFVQGKVQILEGADYTRNCDELPDSSQRAPRELPSPSRSEICVLICLSKTADKKSFLGTTRRI